MEMHSDGVGGQVPVFDHAARAAGRGSPRPDRATTA